MILSKSSLHYRLIIYTYGERHCHHISLCKYFWSILAAIIFHPVVRLDHRLGKYEFKSPVSDETLKIILVSILIGAIVFGLMIDWINTLIIIGISSGIIGLIVGIAILVLKIQDYLDSRPYKQKMKREHHTLILAKEFIESKKMKVCPLIQFVER